MIASMHVADVGARAALGVQRRTPKPERTPGLRHADTAGAARLSSSVLPHPDLGRVGLVAFWDDDASLDRFLAEDPLAEPFASGWHVRLAPLRAHGTWPGLDDDVSTGYRTDLRGPAAVLTVGRLRLSQLPRFVRVSAKAEGRVVQAPGLVWTSGFTKPPFVATCSLWEDEDALSEYAYGAAQPEHKDAIAEGRRKAFHNQQAFIRFRPYGSTGSLGGKNPLSESWMTPG